MVTIRDLATWARFLLGQFEMPKKGPVEFKECHSIRELQRMLDKRYREIRKTAQADWQKLFASSAPGGFSVCVRISKKKPVEPSIPGFGWISSPKIKSSPNGKFPVARFAR